MANSPRDQPIRQWKAIHYHLWKASGISIFGASQYIARRSGSEERGDQDGESVSRRDDDRR
ncbi:hypothetical protein, partial [Bradyrhizobium elkanii]|uniref:hypothetical protein n=1 Tax=Bradyrhizobium elkanii TaxID=29448 RepID=UPI001AEE02C8